MVVNAANVDDIYYDLVTKANIVEVTSSLQECKGDSITIDYTQKKAPVKVDDTGTAPVRGSSLSFKARGTGRKSSWSFAVDDESLAKIAAEAAENAEAQDPAKYIDITKSGNARYYVPARNYEEIMLPDGKALPATEDLTFKFGEKAFYVSGHGGGWADAIVFNGNDQFVVIPNCQEGEIITFNAKRATKASDSKHTCIQAMNGAAIAPEGLLASTGIQDSMQLGAEYANFKFEVKTAGDITFRISNCYATSIDIQPQLPRNYNVVAAYVDGDKTIVLKELVAKTEGITGSTIKVNYPYWLIDNNARAYTHGTKGSELAELLDLKNGEGDTTFVISYKMTDYEGVVFLSEGENLTGAVECTSGNTIVRSSMGKAGYVNEDLKLATLQPGTYKIRAVLFDADKEPAYICTLTKGAGEENKIYLSAVTTNWTETESNLLTITEATDITLKASGDDNHGIDVIMIYGSTNDTEDDTQDKMLYTEDVSTSRGTQMILPIQLENTKSIAGFQFDMTLPDGIQYVKYEKTSRMNSHSVSTNKLSDNKTRFLVSVIGEQEIAVGTGTVLNLTFSIPATYTAGNYTVTISNIELTHNEGINVETINQSDTTSKLIVVAAKPGDANGDNKVSVTDVTSIINYILQKIPSTFIFEAADVNGDKKISVTDVTMTINIVLGKTGSNARRRDGDNENEPE